MDDRFNASASARACNKAERSLFSCSAYLTSTSDKACRSDAISSAWSRSRWMHRSLTSRTASANLQDQSSSASAAAAVAICRISTSDSALMASMFAAWTRFRLSSSAFAASLSLLARSRARSACSFACSAGADATPICLLRAFADAVASRNASSKAWRSARPASSLSRACCASSLATSRSRWNRSHCALRSLRDDSCACCKSANFDSASNALLEASADLDRAASSSDRAKPAAMAWSCSRAWRRARSSRNRSNSLKAASPANFDSAPKCRTASSSARACAVSSAAFFSVARRASRSLSTLFKDLVAWCASFLAFDAVNSASRNDFSAVLWRSSASPRSKPLRLSDAFSTSNFVFISRNSSNAASASVWRACAPPACARISARARSDVAFSVCNDATKPAKRAASCRAAWWSWWTPDDCVLSDSDSASNDATLDCKERFSTSSASPLDFSAFSASASAAEAPILNSFFTEGASTLGNDTAGFVVCFESLREGLLAEEGVTVVSSSMLLSSDKRGDLSRNAFAFSTTEDFGVIASTLESVVFPSSTPSIVGLGAGLPAPMVMDIGAFFGDGFAGVGAGAGTLLTTFMTGRDTTGFWADGAVSMDSLSEGEGDLRRGNAPPTRTRTGSLWTLSSSRRAGGLIRRGDGDRRLCGDGDRLRL
mmetsp:Transcript_19764/g.56089  ORF Transcript_19764/g.56089 Transcript_19764/m.56089 type:complete len:657 (+) Transcript_19764:462-2432(+)